jgi:hypothetical protein
MICLALNPQMTMTLLKQLEQITDPRKDINLKHNLVDVVFLTLSAILSGGLGGSPFRNSEKNS